MFSHKYLHQFTERPPRRQQSRHEPNKCRHHTTQAALTLMEIPIADSILRASRFKIQLSKHRICFAVCALSTSLSDVVTPRPKHLVSWSARP